MDVDLSKLWESLLKTDETLHIPLIYVVVPLGVIALVSLFCCIFCWIRCCCEETEVNVVANVAPTPLPRRRCDADYVIAPSRRNVRQSEDACIELDPNAVEQMKATYKKRHYHIEE
ncbi:hypothetical protein KR222_007102 [Zaprionus bogoriensis]|nr:hypothetical protein KR222_007102 [Zaprionus bogoriensis]